MAITVDPDSLAADGAALAGRQTAGSAPGCEPAGADSVSAGVVAQLSAHLASLTALINHAQQLRADGGTATQHTATSLRAADDAGAGLIAGTTTSAAVSAPTSVASVSAPVLPAIPPMPPLAPMTGEAHATAIHTGPGPASLRAFADYWHSQAATLDDVAAETSQTAAAIDAHWIDGHQTAGANTAAHGSWLSDSLAPYARSVASAATEAADNFDQAKAATPSPQEFTSAHGQLTRAIQANLASRGLLSAQVHAAAARLAQMQGQSTTAAAAHHAASAATMNSIKGPPAPAPPIAKGGGPTAPHLHGTKGRTAQNAGGKGSAAQHSSDPGTAANTAVGSPLGVPPGIGGGALQQIAQSALPAAAMLPTMAMSPLSALSGLAGQSRNDTPTMTAGFAGQPDEAAPEADLAGDIGETSPAAGGASGGGGEAVGGAAPTPPVSSPSQPPPPSVSGPAPGAVRPAEGAATAPAGAVGGGMSTYPPMMGATGDSGAARNVRLFPDRRLVWRPVPNTEAVFGELPRERRPRAKRATPDKPEEGTNEG